MKSHVTQTIPYRIQHIQDQHPVSIEVQRANSWSKDDKSINIYITVSCSFYKRFFNVRQGRRADPSSPSSKSVDRLNKRRSRLYLRRSPLGGYLASNSARNARLRWRRYKICPTPRCWLSSPGWRKRRILGLGSRTVIFLQLFVPSTVSFRNILLHNDQQRTPVGLISSPNVNNNYHSYPKIDESVSFF